MVRYWNKIDLLGEAERAALLNQARRNQDLPLSAVTGEGCVALVTLSISASTPIVPPSNLTCR
jgi:50S ribosomal subunit-associated GTPase HflX